MTVWESIVLGVVQGLTEFLPISSTAHLYVVPQWLGWGRPSTAFVAVIQLGTLVAVLAYFWREVIQISRETVTGKSRMGWLIAVGTVPVVVLGLLFKRHIETTLTGMPVIAGAMIGLAGLLAVAECWARCRPRTRGMESVGWRDAMAVGLAQAVALIPGASRSGCTITGAMLMGLDRATAARFSFLLSLPAIFAAGIFQLVNNREALLGSQADALNLLAGTVVAGVVGYASIAFLLGYLKRHTTWLFILYRLALGLGILAWA
jgi:undecaprenyl-diphosphatase